MSTSLVSLLAYRGCGGRWVRDVLSAAEALQSAAGSGSRRGALAASTLSERIDDLSSEGWDRRAGERDRAIVVLRDPRDLLVAWMHSVTSSQGDDSRARLREPFLLMDATQRLLVLSAGFGRCERWLRSWVGRESTERVWLTTYERLVADPVGEFAKIFGFLGWQAAPGSIDSLLDRYSGESRSDRERAEEGVQADSRRVEPGDWKRHFDSLSGLYFERVAPGLLAELGYDVDTEWYDRLEAPASIEGRGRRRLEVRLARLKEENQRLKGRRIQMRVQLLEKSQRSSPTLIFLNVHRAASTFVSQWLAPAIALSLPATEHLQYQKELYGGKSPADLPVPPTGMVVSRLYPEEYSELVEEPPPVDGRHSDKRLVMIGRDPRDVAVSLYYSWAYSHRAPIDERAREQFLARREQLLELEPAEAILRYTAEPALRQFLIAREFLDAYPKTLLLSYEQMVSDFPRFMAALGEKMGWMPSGSARLAELLGPELAPPPEDDPYSHKRRVRPGGWREHFGDRLKLLFKERAGDQFERAGYRW